MDYPIFDIHWHARDEEQASKETILRSISVAHYSGIVALAAMPNTQKPLTTLERCQEYLSLDKYASGVKFYVHIGLTPNPEQVKRAVEAVRKEPRIIGMKAYWGESTGDLKIIHKEEQYRVLETLVKEGYEGVLMSHCEKESEMNAKLYDPSNPRTWSTKCRPEKAERLSYADITEMARELNFKGTLHVCHVSTVEVVDSISVYNGLKTGPGGPFKLSCGITPHHFLLDYKKLDGPDGTWYKCNPPLRSPATMKGLQERVLGGAIPIIESDHAPHAAEDKQGEKPASGLACGTSWPYITKKLEKLGMSEKMIRAAVFDNAVELFNLDLKPSEVKVNYTALKQMQAQYPHDPFKDFKT